MTKQEIMAVIVGCAEKLKHVPTFEELVQMTQISHPQIKKHFGGYTRALLECNLEPKEIGRGACKLPLEKLFTEWAGIVRKLKKLPSRSEYEMHSKYTGRPVNPAIWQLASRAAWTEAVCPQVRPRRRMEGRTRIGARAIRSLSDCAFAGAVVLA